MFSYYRSVLDCVPTKLQTSYKTRNIPLLSKHWDRVVSHTTKKAPPPLINPNTWGIECAECSDRTVTVKVSPHSAQSWNEVKPYFWGWKGKWISNGALLVGREGSLASVVGGTSDKHFMFHHVDLLRNEGWGMQSSSFSCLPPCHYQ